MKFVKQIIIKFILYLINYFVKSRSVFDFLLFSFRNINFLFPPFIAIVIPFCTIHYKNQ